MTEKEQIALLKMQNAELKKEKDRFEKELKTVKERADGLEEDLEVLSRAVRSGKEKLRLELFLKFGSSSEKYRKLFNIPVELLQANESELSDEEKQLLEQAKTAVEGAQESDEKPKSSRNRHPKGRKRSTGGGRQTFDPSYPRERKEYTLDGHCSSCGNELIEIKNQDVHEYIDIIKESLKIIQQSRHKYYCPGCGSSGEDMEPNHRTIVTAPAPSRFIPGGLAGDDLIAGSIVDKFFYGLSVTRIAKRFRQLGIQLSEQNFSNWHLRAGKELISVAHAIRDEILRQPAVNADETRLQVLDEAGRADELKSWLWVICSATPDLPAAYFEYDASRSSDVFKGIVGEYAGFLQADCYAGYQTERQNYQFTLALCLAHMRRRFVDAQKAGGYQSGSAGFITLNKILQLIGRIYKVDSVLRTRWQVAQTITEQQFITQRKAATLPLFKKLTAWVTGRYDMHLADEFIMDGMNYYLGHEELFSTYLDCANLNPDNSRTERIIRSYSTVRMNALFAGCVDGANTMATLESIIQTANLWDLDLYAYVAYLLGQMTLIRDMPAHQVDYSQYLPWNLSPELKVQMSVDTITRQKD
ncbi:MAG: IS66 family transposase, partial [Spirochaetia bacterium]|nr:IS66 family transposase [Spirochaetia bacterium]